MIAKRNVISSKRMPKGAMRSRTIWPARGRNPSPSIKYKITETPTRLIPTMLLRGGPARISPKTAPIRSRAQLSRYLGNERSRYTQRYKTPIRVEIVSWEREK